MIAGGELYAQLSVPISPFTVSMLASPLNILLADDDNDDNFFFNKALKEINLDTHLTTVGDGERLMTYLSTHTDLPDIIFLDLSMPRKTGFECLAEIKENDLLNKIPIVVLSTSFSRNLVYEENLKMRLKDMGAQSYINKPNDFAQLVDAIRKILEPISKNGLNQRAL